MQMYKFHTMFGVLKIMFGAVAIVASFGASAQAATSPWQELGGGKARLVASLDPATSQVSGVVEFMLNDGWKTYWRQPGASGIPPQFDFSGSRHFAAGEVAFPVPEYVVAGETDFIGYHGDVRFPFEGMVTMGGGGDSLIKLSLLAGVCEEICIPATAEFEMPVSELMTSDPQAEEIIAEAKLLLPGEPESDFRVETVNAADDALEITALVPDEKGKAELFVEGPASWQLLPAKLTGRQGKTVQFLLDLSRMPKGEKPAGTELRFTLVSNGKGVEQRLKPGG